MQKLKTHLEIDSIFFWKDLFGIYFANIRLYMSFRKIHFVVLNPETNEIKNIYSSNTFKNSNNYYYILIS